MQGDGGSPTANGGAEVTPQEAKQTAEALLEASKGASRTPWTHRSREEWGYGTKSWVEPISSEPFGPIYASEQTLANHKFVEICGNNAPQLSQAYLDVLTVLEQIANSYTHIDVEFRGLEFRKMARDFLQPTQAPTHD